MGSTRSWVLGLVAVAGGIVVGLHYNPGPSAPAPPPVAGPSPLAAESAPATVRYPIEAEPVPNPGAASASELPALEESDAAVIESLVGLAGLQGLADSIAPEHLIQRVVATIDNLPRKKLALQLLPVKPTPGAFVVARSGERQIIDPSNFARYAPFVQVAEAVDARMLVAWYRGFYPLFQQAYRQLGYPDRYFNDRLVEVIDHLLETPAPAQPIALTHPEAYYEYAELDLQNRSAGQKIMLRMGPDNAARVKAKLGRIRRELTGRESAP